MPYVYQPYQYQPQYQMPQYQMQPQGQLEQLRAAQAQQQAMYAQPVQQAQIQTQRQQSQQGNIVLVQGEAGAKAYVVVPGASMLLMDAETQAFYIKSVDASGMPTFKAYDYTERNPQAKNAQQANTDTEPHVEYATKAELEEMWAKVNAVLQARTLRETHTPTPVKKEGSKDGKPSV